MQRLWLYTPAIGVFLSLVFLVQGCGSDPNKPPREMGKVTGTVTLDGKPVKGVTVVFSPEEGGGESEGATDEKGHFELEYSGGGKFGALVGKHKISFRDEGEEMINGEPIPGGNEGRGQIPEKYLFGKSTIERDVKSGEQVIDFELRS